MEIEYVVTLGKRKALFPEDNLTVGTYTRSTLEGAYLFVDMMRHNPEIILVWWKITKRVIEEELIAEGT
jgi:hypothetical protein